MKLKYPLVHSGKVRDIYLLPNKNWLIVATDRVSAYDVVLPTEIPGRGVILTQLSNFWMKKFTDIVPNHMVSTMPAYGDTAEEQNWLRGRSVEVKRAIPLKVEAIARGFLSGSAYTQYKDTGQVNGIRLRSDLELSQRLPEPIFTPSTKAPVGEHDENITFEDTVRLKLLKQGMAFDVRRITLQLYGEAAKYAKERGIIIADTKFEFGQDPYTNKLMLIDEVLTPDSSRFWDGSEYVLGKNPPSMDKQIIRDYLDEIKWNRKEPAPELPDEIVDRVVSRYEEVFSRLTKTF